MTRPPGLFITGTDTGVGKTYVAAMIARSLWLAGHRVGVYKPAASGCRADHGQLVSDDAVELWEAAGRPGTLEQVCPQRFHAPLAPHLAAEAEGKRLDAELLVEGLQPWLRSSSIILVEGAGGLLSPLGDDSVAELAARFGYPLVVVARNALGTINHTRLTLEVAAARKLPVAGVVLNTAAPAHDPSVDSNRRELQRLCGPLLAGVAWGAESFDAPLDWFRLAKAPGGE